MSRIIINNDSKIIDDSRALNLVKMVIEGGRISNKNKQYCYLTIFEVEGRNIGVATQMNKKSDSFFIYDHGKVFKNDDKE